MGPKQLAALAGRAVRTARGKTIADAAAYAASSALATLLGGVSRALLARLLTVATFGAYSFALSLLQYSSMVFEFGLFVPASRLAARADAAGKRRVAGAALLTYVPVGAAFCLVVLLLSLVTDSVFRVHSSSLLRIVTPLAFVFPLSLIGFLLAQGLGRVSLYALSSVAANVLFTAALAVATALGLDLTAAGALILRALATGCGLLALAVALRPVFQGALHHVRTLAREARAYGFQVYLGRLLAMGTYNMDVLMLGALTGARTVALYTLAGALAAVAGLPAAGLASALFPRMVRARSLDPRWLWAVWALGAGTALVLSLLAGLAIRAAVSSSYAAAAGYVLPLALAEAVRGVTGIYNSFLAAKALGRQLRNAGLILTGSNLVLNLALIPPFGGAGAAWASLAALLANLAAHVLAYRRAITAHPPDAAPY